MKANVWNPDNLSFTIATQKIFFSGNWFLRKSLIAGTIPENKNFYVRTVSAIENLFLGNFSTNNNLFAGTIPAKKGLFAKTPPVGFLYIFSSFIDSLAKKKLVMFVFQFVGTILFSNPLFLWGR